MQASQVEFSRRFSTERSQPGPFSSRRKTVAKRNVYRGLLLAVALLAAGCAKPPQAEMQAAQAALDEAKTSGAESYAPESFSKAQESMAQAKAEVDAQGSKFFLMRSYGKAK